MNGLEGLDLSEAMVPPLLRPNAACSWPVFEAWEHFVVAQLLDRALPIARAFDHVALTAERLRAWDVQDGPLDQWAALVASDGLSADAPEVWQRSFERSRRARHLVLSCVPADIRPEGEELTAGEWQRGAQAADDASRLLRRYLAARFWASWVVHDGGGLRTGVRWIALVHDVLLWELGRTCRRPCSVEPLLEAIGRTDLLLVHLLNPSALARRLSTYEPQALDS